MGKPGIKKITARVTEHDARALAVAIEKLSVQATALSSARDRIRKLTPADSG